MYVQTVILIQQRHQTFCDRYATLSARRFFAVLRLPSAVDRYKTDPPEPVFLRRITFITGFISCIHFSTLSL